VPRSELACCRVGWDDASRVAQPNNAALRLSSEPAARVCCQLACLHGVGNWRPTRHCGEACASRWHHVHIEWSWSEAETAHANEQVVGGEAETPRARQRILMQRRDLSCEAEICRGSLLSAEACRENFQPVESKTSCDGLDVDPQSSLY
jgi:hypothetical protein